MILQVGVKIFLKNDKDKYLIIRRSPIKYPDVKGEWDIVGGRINPGSSLMDNLRREVKEETQLDILGTPTLVYAQDIIPNTEKHVVRLSYIGEAVGEPILDISENIEYKWVSIEEMKHHDNLDIYIKKLLDTGLFGQKT